MFDEEPQFSSIRQWLHVVSRLLIMAGMMIFFASVMSLGAMYLIEYGMGVNVHEAIRSNLDPSQTQQILALKVFQVLAGSIGMFLLPAYFFPKAVSSSLKNYVPYRSKVYWPLWLIGAALMIVSNPFNAWLYQINQHLSLPAYLADWEASIRVMEESSAKLTKVLIASNDIPALLLNIFVVALMPAICEELFFRGVLQNYLRIATDNAILAIIISAVIFSAFHGQFYAFLPRVMMGVVLGMAYNYTANIKVPILMHFMNNGLAVVLFYVYKDEPNAAWIDESYTFAWYWVVLSAGATFAGLYFLRPLVVYYIKNRFNKNLG